MNNQRIFRLKDHKIITKANVHIFGHSHALLHDCKTPEKKKKISLIPHHNIPIIKEKIIFVIIIKRKQRNSLKKNC